MLARQARGQASITDALYFLVIVSGLAALLFVFANGYGQSVSNQVGNQFGVDYATAALKTILYSSTPRDPSESIYMPNAEIDHLLAFVKEDYADDGLLEAATSQVLARNIRLILAPIADSYDYLFYIRRTDTAAFVFAFLHLSQFDTTGTLGEVKFSPGTPAHKDYFCGCPSPLDTGGNELTPQKIDLLVANVGDSSQSLAQLILLEEEPGVARQPRQVPALAELILWQGTDVSKAFNKSEWACRENPCGS